MILKTTTCHNYPFSYPYHFLMVGKKRDTKGPNFTSLSLEKKNEKKRNCLSIMVIKTTTFENF